MMKKAQAQIITTVLIILLVLAAIVIVWQVVSGTIEEGGETIESQSECIGFTMDATGGVGDTAINVISTADIVGWRVYVNDVEVDAGTHAALDAFESGTSGAVTALVLNDKLTAAGFLDIDGDATGDQWCPGINENAAE